MHGCCHGRLAVHVDAVSGITQAQSLGPGGMPRLLWGRSPGLEGMPGLGPRLPWGHGPGHGACLGHASGPPGADPQDLRPCLGIHRARFGGIPWDSRGMPWACTGTVPRRCAGLRACLWHTPEPFWGHSLGLEGHALGIHRGHLGGIPRDSGACLGHTLGMFGGHFSGLGRLPWQCAGAVLG